MSTPTPRPYAEIKAELDAAEQGVLDELVAAKEADRTEGTEASRARRKAAVDAVQALRVSQREARGGGMSVAVTAEPALEG